MLDGPSLALLTATSSLVCSSVVPLLKTVMRGRSVNGRPATSLRSLWRFERGPVLYEDWSGVATEGASAGGHAPSGWTSRWRPGPSGGPPGGGGSYEFLDAVDVEPECADESWVEPPWAVWRCGWPECESHRDGDG